NERSGAALAAGALARRWRRSRAAAAQRRTCGGIPPPPIEGSSRHRGSRSDCDRRDPRSRAGGSVIEIATRSRVGRSCDGGIPCRSGDRKLLLHGSEWTLLGDIIASL